jgi:hypothetical protein
MCRVTATAERNEVETAALTISYRGFGDDGLGLQVSVQLRVFDRRLEKLFGIGMTVFGAGNLRSDKFESAL